MPFLTTADLLGISNITKICGKHAERFRSAIAPFAATVDGTDESFARLAALVPEGEPIVLQQAAMIEPPTGLTLILNAETVQVVARHLPEPATGLEIAVLGPSDAPAMLAQLTRPGAFCPAHA